MLKRIWLAWKLIAHKIGNFQARVLLTVLYGVLFPYGLAIRLFSDPLRIKHRPTEWLTHRAEAYDMQWARKQ